MSAWHHALHCPTCGWLVVGCPPPPCGHEPQRVVMNDLENGEIMIASQGYIQQPTGAFVPTEVSMLVRRGGW